MRHIQTQAESPPFPVPHTDYYFEDGNLVILVRGCSVLVRLALTHNPPRLRTHCSKYSDPPSYGIQQCSATSSTSPGPLAEKQKVLTTTNHSSSRERPLSTLSDCSGFCTLCKYYDHSLVRLSAHRDPQAIAVRGEQAHSKSGRPFSASPRAGSSTTFVISPSDRYRPSLASALSTRSLLRASTRSAAVGYCLRTRRSASVRSHSRFQRPRASDSRPRCASHSCENSSVQAYASPRG